MSSESEDAAWRGKSRHERRTTRPAANGRFKEVELKGNIPDFVRFWTGCGIFILGILGLAIFVGVVLPEWGNIQLATTCTGDCFISNAAVVGVGVVTGMGGVMGLFFGVVTAIAASGAFNENTIRAKIREVGVE